MNLQRAKPEAKDESVTVAMSATQKQIISALSVKVGLSISDVVRTVLFKHIMDVYPSEYVSTMRERQDGEMLKKMFKTSYIKGK